MLFVRKIDFCIYHLGHDSLEIWHTGIWSSVSGKAQTMRHFWLLIFFFNFSKPVVKEMNKRNDFLNKNS